MRCVRSASVSVKATTPDVPLVMEMSREGAAAPIIGYEFSEFLLKVAGVEDVGARVPCVATYHDSCHLVRELGVKDEPRRLINGVKGAELREMDMHDACCGFGGTFSVKFPKVSVSMLDEKIENIVNCGADTVVSCDMGCLMNIDGALGRRGISVKTMHIAELLASRDKEVK